MTGLGMMRSGTARELFLAAIEYGVMAPSLRNSQPWRFDIVDESLILRADRSRALPVADPDGRELVISCGAALFNIRTVLQHWGHAARVRLLPIPAQPDVLAQITIGPGRPASDEYQPLIAAMGQRHTHRQPFAAQPVPTTLLEMMAAIAIRENAWLAVLSGQAAEQTAELVGAAARRQLSSPEYLREAGAWTRVHASASDGVAAAALGHSSTVALLGARLRRWWDDGFAEAAAQADLARNAPALVVLGTSGDTPRAWLSAGQALQHILLAGSRAGVAASFLNQPIQVREFRRWLVNATGLSGAPQAVLRLGYAVASGRMSRRPVSDVVTITA